MNRPSELPEERTNLPSPYLFVFHIFSKAEYNTMGIQQSYPTGSETRLVPYCPSLFESRGEAGRAVPRSVLGNNSHIFEFGLAYCVDVEVV